MTESLTVFSYSFPPLALGYVAGVGFVGLILIQMARIRFKRRYHRIFIAALVAILLSLVTRIWQVSANDAQSFLIAFIPGVIFEGFTNALGYHFVMQFIRARLTNWQKLTTVVAYAGAVVYIAVYTVSTGSIIRIAGTWYTDVSLQEYLFIVSYGAISSLAILGFLVRYYLVSESPLLKSQTGFLLVGLLVPFAAGIITSILNLTVFRPIPPLDWLTAPVAGSIVLAGFQKHGFLTAMPTAEEQASSPPKYDLATGFSYLLLNSEPNRIYEIFDDLIEHDHFGLCVSRVFPDTIRHDYAIKSAPVIWLSESSRSDAIAPTDLVGLALTVQNFLEKAESPVVLLHGLEYLIFNNGFKPILRMIHHFGEVNAEKRGIMLIALVSASLTERQQAMLKAECKAIDQTELGLRAWLKGASRP